VNADRRDPEKARAFVTGWYERWNAGDKAAWLEHSAFPNNLSWQFWTFMPTMTLMGPLNERVR